MTSWHFIAIIPNNKQEVTMKVNIEMQYLCTKKQQLRGIPYYMMNLIRTLVDRDVHKYSISFFDYNKEKHNIDYLHEYLGVDWLKKLDVRECNSLSYRTIIDGIVSGNHSIYDTISYEEYVGTNADVIHFPSVHSIPTNVRGKTVVTVHDIIPCIPEFSSQWLDRSQLTFYKSVQYIKKQEDIVLIADSESTKRDLVSDIGVNEDRIFVVPLSYDDTIHYHDEDSSLLEKMNIDAPYILYLGALDHRKGIVNLLDAFEILKEKYKDIKLVLAGSLNADVTPVIDRLKNCKYKEDIILPGFVDDYQKRVLLSHAMVFVFPSEYEGFGLPVLEAMACGSPVITTNVSSLPEVGGDAALYVTPQCPEELASQMERFINSDSLRQEYIQKGYEQSRKFSWDKTAAMTEKVYQIAYEQQ